MSFCSHYHYFLFFFFFFNDTATTEIYTLSLHDALPISVNGDVQNDAERTEHLEADLDDLAAERDANEAVGTEDRKSTRLNSSHGYISYAVFCLKKKKKKIKNSNNHKNT